MKKIIISLAALLSCAFCFAQDWSGETQVSRKGVEYPSYMTNFWSDNLYFGAQGGISTRFTTAEKDGMIKQSFINPVFDVYALKWVTPCLGLRFGIGGGNGREGLWYYHPYQINHSPFPYKVNGTDSYVASSPDEGVLYYGSANVHGDILLNITNTFFGYVPLRFYSLSAYASAGAMLLYDNKTSSGGISSQNYDREVFIGAGLYNIFHLTRKLVATADLGFYGHPSRYRSTQGIRTFVPRLQIGIAYNINRASWTDMKAVSATVSNYKEAQEVAQTALEQIKQEKEELVVTVNDLNEEVDSLKQNVVIAQPVEVSYADLFARAEKAEIVLYFPLGQSTLNFSELQHLDNYAKIRLENDPEFVFHLIGSADAGTGSEKVNSELSFNRANFVKKILVEKYGVKEENITIDVVITDTHSDGALDRCVLIEKQ